MSKKQTPRSDFKSFRLDGSSREMGILYKYYGCATNFEYLCSMTIEIHNMIPRGLNVGFEFYSEDDFGGPQDFYELHINLLLIKVVFFWDK